MVLKQTLDKYFKYFYPNIKNVLTWYTFIISAWSNHIFRISSSTAVIDVLKVFKFSWFGGKDDSLTQGYVRLLSFNVG